MLGMQFYLTCVGFFILGCGRYCATLFVPNLYMWSRMKELKKCAKLSHNFHVSIFAFCINEYVFGHRIIFCASRLLKAHFHTERARWFLLLKRQVLEVFRKNRLVLKLRNLGSEVVYGRFSAPVPPG